jgi:hypothetical protein
VLIYEKKCKIRTKVWNGVFNAMVSLLNYLIQCQHRLNIVQSLRLQHQVLVVLNYFITFGDAFLPNPAAYDFLYYEIARQDNVFHRLAQAVAEFSKEADFGEWPSKVENQLVNILSIIKHIRPMLENVSLTYPTEEQVIKLVQDSFVDLTLKLFDGLEVVERWDEVDVEKLPLSLTKNAITIPKVDWNREMDHREVTQRLSSISD